MALPVSAGYQAQIDLAIQGLAGLSGIFNPQRRSLAYNTAAGLNEAGLTRGLMPQEINEGGNLVYRLVRGPDGRLFSQAHRQVGEAHGSRGTFYSSFRQRDQRDARRELDNKINATFRGFGEQQQQITDQQAAQARELQGRLGTLRGEYTDWQAAQQVPTPPEPAPSPLGTAPAGGTGGAAGREFLWAGAAPPNSAIMNQRYGNKWSIITRGPGAPPNQRYLVVRA